MRATIATATTDTHAPRARAAEAGLGLLRLPTAAARRLGAAGVAAQAHAGARLAACAIGLCARQGAGPDSRRHAGRSLAAKASAEASRPSGHDRTSAGDLLAA